MVVYDLNDTSQYVLGCSTVPTGGKFTLRLGYSPGLEPGAYYAQIDLHQLGAGYQGHVWFTHVYPPDYLDGGYSENHQVTATWTPELGLGDGQTQQYDVLAHLPSHGANYQSAEYSVFPDTGDDAVIVDQQENKGCVIHQDSVTDGNDAWVYLGHYGLSRGARVELNNIGGSTADGTVDIGFDSMAFVPINGSGHGCGDGY